MNHRAVIFGCEGLALTPWETGFFAETDPLGFILFARNCDSPGQVQALVRSLRESVGRDDAPVLIDQEGGRVQRLKPPHWRAAPASGRFGRLAEVDLASAREAVRLNAQIIAAELAALGIDVDCLPCLDLQRPEGHAVIGDRSFGPEPSLVADLGRACCAGLMTGGVLPVIKHMPGHGRAVVDSHLELPRVAASRDELEALDFVPFRHLADMPLGMTAHIVFEAIDPDQPATTSAVVIEEVIRGSIGFQGLLLTDDLSMEALDGTIGDRATRALGAGCDIALHCNGERDEMEAAAKAVGPMTGSAARRWLDARGRRTSAAPGDIETLSARLDDLMRVA